MVIEAYQIFYNQDTFLKLQKGFIPLDNSNNDRPDWREYWPIKTWAENNEMKEGIYYGFFSPKFLEKTNLSFNDIHQFTLDKNENYDLISFSPFLDQSAVYINVFEQGEVNHRGLKALIERYLLLRGIEINLNSIITDHSKFIFSNFFLAKKKFWDKWFYEMEILYNLCEDIQSELGKGFSSKTTYLGQNVAHKVFFMERLASLLLILDKSLTVKSYPPTKLPFTPTRISNYRNEIITAEALKRTFISTNEYEFLNAMIQLRTNLVNLLSVK